ncbi:MAG: sigma-70 family RNA polymerase sigma factor [Actinomycetota bacterium]|nr:sigma-70 family RNA polymerase sigma factor [Actinomycetota bacterium]
MTTQEERPIGVGPAAEAADFDDIFRAHYGPLVRSLTVACGNAELAADCVEDGFERAYVRWRKVSRYDNPVAWIRRVAINRMRDHLRREERRARATERLWGDARLVDELPEPPDDRLQRALAALPDQQRIAVSLHYVADLSVAEIAETMSLSSGAVKYHLHAGRNRLRSVLEPEPLADAADDATPGEPDGSSSGATGPDPGTTRTSSPGTKR